MKLFRNIILALSVLTAFTFESCSKVENVESGEEIPVSYSVSLLDTKSVNADGSAINMVWFALYNMDGTLATNYAPVEFKNGSAHCEVVMMRGRSYKIVFVAQHYKNSSTPTYPVDLQKGLICVPTDPVANTDQMDLFYGTDEIIAYNGNPNDSVVLERVVTMVNFISSDEDWNNAVVKPTHSSIRLKGVSAGLELFGGRPAAEKKDLFFAKSQIPEDKHLGAVFCIAEGKIDATIDLYTSDDQNALPVKTASYTDIQVETNKKTNIVGGVIGSHNENSIEYTLSQGYASKDQLNNSASHRVKTNMIYGSFSVKVNEGYVIRAVYTYPTEAVTSEYTEVLANCTDRTEINVLNEGRYAVITFAKASDPTASISPSEDIVKSLTKYEIALPAVPGSPINKAVFFGDSIMHGVYSYFEENNGEKVRKNGFDSNSDTYLRIPDYFGLLAEASVTNNAKRGSGWITDTRNLGNALEMAKKTNFAEYDFAAFCLGINDWIQGATIGSLDQPGNTGGSISEGTVVANMIACFEKVRTDNPQCKIVVYSPYISWGQCSAGGDYEANVSYGDASTNYALGAKNSKGYTLQDLINVIDDVCNRYDIRHVPLSQSTVCTLKNVKDVMIDGLHPSREVRAMLALELLEKAGY